MKRSALERNQSERRRWHGNVTYLVWGSAASTAAAAAGLLLLTSFDLALLSLLAELADEERDECEPELDAEPERELDELPERDLFEERHTIS